MLIAACTTYEEGPQGLSLSEEELSFSSSAGQKVVTIVTAEKWDITDIPDWIKVEDINSDNFRNFEWTISLSATANDGYDRNGTIVFQSKSYTQSLTVSQEGNKGRYVAVESVSLDETELFLAVGDSRQLTASVLPKDASDNTVSWETSSPGVASVDKSGKVTAVSTGTATITATTKDGGKVAICEVTVKPLQAYDGEDNGHRYVNLGLPSGIMWATCNVGATSPEGYGEYFAWGEIEPYYETGYAQSSNPVWKSGKLEGYDWPSYKWCKGSSTTQTKYCTKSSYGTVDNKTVLDPEDDAASVNWGGNWRMPTDADWTELRTKCTWSLTIQKGINGLIVTGPNGNSIFLPAAGYRSNTYVNSIGNECRYWSSSLYQDSYCAWFVYFYSGDVNNGSLLRSAGFSVRPVWNDKPIVPVESVNIDQNTLSITEGDVATLTAIVHPDNATTADVTWISDTPSVATVTSGGVVTAVAPGTATVTATTVDGGMTASCTVTVKAKTIALTGVKLNKNSMNLGVGLSETLVVTYEPEHATNKLVSWKSDDEAIATVDDTGKVTGVNVGSVRITVTSNEGGFSAYCMVSVKTWSGSSTGSNNGHDWVDLGLPSGIKWATCNVGASSPDEYGNHFAWGETSTKNAFSFANLKYCTDKDGYHYSKYVPSTQPSYWSGSSPLDNKKTLDSSDDAASVNWGGTWRMPTMSEMEELINNCSWTWTSFNGTNGYRVTSSINGNSIFLPAAGYRYNLTPEYAESSGCYWSSSLGEKGPRETVFLGFSESRIYVNSRYRYLGQTVRPVTEE